MKSQKSIRKKMESKAAEIALQTRVVTGCVRCDGSGEMCNSCGESADACECRQDRDIVQCVECKGTGK